MELIGVCVAFALAIAGASFIFWLSDRAGKRREADAVALRQASDALLQAQMQAQEKLLLGLVDRIQSPTPQAFAARQEAAAKAAALASVTPEERERVLAETVRQERDLTVNDYFSEQRWKSDPALSKYTDIVADGDEVVMEWEEGGMPYMERVPQGEFVLTHVLRPRR